MSTFLKVQKRHFISCYLFLRNTQFTHMPNEKIEIIILSFIWNCEKVATTLKSIKGRTANQYSDFQNVSLDKVYQQHVGIC